MAFTPTNPILFTAAYSGALAGMLTSGRWLGAAGSNATAISTIAGAFAQAFDGEWDDGCVEVACG